MLFLPKLLGGFGCFIPAITALPPNIEMVFAVPPITPLRPIPPDKEDANTGYRVGGELVPVRPHHLAYGSVPRRLVKCWQTAPYKSAHHGSLACATSGYSSRTAYDGVGPETTSVCADSILSPHPQGARVRSFSSLGFSV